MPTYDYRCDGCGHTFAEFQSITAAALTDCPACREPKLRRLIGSGAGIIFKGSGFYETDYKRGRTGASPASAPGGGEKKSDGPGPSEKKSGSGPSETKGGAKPDTSAD